MNETGGNAIRTSSLLEVYFTRIGEALKNNFYLIPMPSLVMIVIYNELGDTFLSSIKGFDEERDDVLRVDVPEGSS